MVTNPITIDDFHTNYPRLNNPEHISTYYGLRVGDLVVSKRESDRWSSKTIWRIVSIGAEYDWSRYRVLLEMPTRSNSVSEKYDQYWSYGLNEKGQQVIRRIMLLTSLKKITEEEEKEIMPCNCRRGHCYCEDPTLTYEINEHSSTVDVSRGYKTIRLTMDECAELASFLSSAKSRLKEAKLAALKEQQDELAKQVKEIEAM